jgi:hypothetical protein
MSWMLNGLRRFQEQLRISEITPALGNKTMDHCCISLTNQGILSDNAFDYSTTAHRQSPNMAARVGDLLAFEGGFLEEALVFHRGSNLAAAALVPRPLWSEASGQSLGGALASWDIPGEGTQSGAGGVVIPFVRRGA